MAGGKLSSVEKMITGLNHLFREFDSVYLLKLGACNDELICSTERYFEKFSFPSFFQMTLMEAAENLPEGDIGDMSELRSDLYKNLLNVLHKSSDIARKLQAQIDKKEETAFSTQLAHRLLIPLHKEYTIDHHSRKHTTECVCFKEKPAGRFEDTSMGPEKVWHGSTDFLIGRTKKVAVCINNHDDEEEEEPNMDKEKIFSTSSTDRHLDQFIAETILFGQLQFNESDMESLMPMIVISKTDVKIYFYDSQHDFLLESSTMPLLTEDGEELQYDTVVALWLAINYHITCTGITEDVFNTGFTADFRKTFDEKVIEQYKKLLHFRIGRKKPDLFDRDSPHAYEFFGGFSKPLKIGHKCLTDKHYGLIRAKKRKLIAKQEGNLTLKK